jgi:hypothetical protein
MAFSKCTFTNCMNKAIAYVPWVIGVAVSAESIVVGIIVHQIGGVYINYTTIKNQLHV